MSKFYRFAALMVAPVMLLGVAVVPALAADDAKKNLVETASAAGDFTTLLAAAQAAGLAETLSTGGPFTVLAPTDAAFKKLPEGTVDALLKDPEKLKSILLHHVIDGSVMSKDVVKLKSAKSKLGQDLKINAKDGVVIGGAKVVKADIAASNGVIHVIDTVILPESK